MTASRMRHGRPDGVFFVAADNSIEDDAIAYDMNSALSDRPIHLHVSRTLQKLSKEDAAFAALAV